MAVDARRVGVALLVHRRRGVPEAAIPVNAAGLYFACLEGEKGGEGGQQQQRGEGDDARRTSLSWLGQPLGGTAPNGANVSGRGGAEAWTGSSHSALGFVLH